MTDPSYSGVRRQQRDHYDWTDTLVHIVTAILPALIIIGVSIFTAIAITTLWGA